MKPMLKFSEITNDCMYKIWNSFWLRRSKMVTGKKLKSNSKSTSPTKRPKEEATETSKRLFNKSKSNEVLLAQDTKVVKTKSTSKRGKSCSRDNPVETQQNAGDSNDTLLKSWKSFWRRRNRNGERKAKFKIISKQRNGYSLPK